MKKISFADISISVLKYIFNWRFWIAEITKKSKIYKKIVDKLLFEDDEIIVIPNTISVNKKIESEGSEFLPTEIIKEVIKRSNDIVIMDSCLCRTSNQCKDYPHDIGCIFLGPTTRKIPKNIGHKATVEEALNQVDMADAAGLSHIIGRNKIDTVWMNVRPGKGLLTICHCCPCCCLWKVYPNLDKDISNKLEKLDGVSVKLHEDNCRLCEKCLDDVCMFQAISLKDNKITIDNDTCKGCGLCVNTCKFDAITIDYSNETIDNVVNRLDDLIEIKEL
ncbi:4Fe-4S binding protein [Methanobrevibacter sp.]|uniref:4Fe-4S binding protein n=1 Tax=Methanobrevibacter sp. TaxID=66852 RepID=UPI0025F19A55|nr:4Fe-4S binding protein [Methanobrevibacter sp.]MBR4448141.1 4Fe-4S binding protein [Methanobrevibacter sp.]